MEPMAARMHPQNALCASTDASPGGRLRVERYGFHHHASLCIAAYAFLMLEQVSGSKKTPLDSKRLP
jgi:hypothetical protein